MVVEEYIPCIIYSGGRNIFELHFTIPNKPGQLRRALKIFSEHNIDLVNISTYSLPDWDRAPVFMFADFTDSDVSIEDIKKMLEQTTGDKVHVKVHPPKRFIIGELAFPLYIFPGVRCLILTEYNFREMIKGFYEKMGETAAVFLYHLAYSGGKFIGKYLAGKLSLKDEALLTEVLKFYQACGWGRVKLVKYDPKKLKIAIRIYDSIECGIFKNRDKPVSQLIRGHISGVLSGLLEKEVRVMETKCIAKGDPYCEFHMEKV